MDIQGERARKAALAQHLRVMREGAAYKAVLDRIAERCGSGKLWWKKWVLAEEEEAAKLRIMARGYIAFDDLVSQMINEGEIATKILDGKVAPGEAGQGEIPNE